MFYIILKGRVSVWLPVAHTAMKKPLLKFKQRVQQEVAILNSNRATQASQLIDLPFRFKDLTPTKSVKKTKSE